MTGETNLWLVRHAPVDGPRGVIHAPEAPANLGDSAAIAALRRQLPAGAPVYASPARRTLETAHALGLTPIAEPAFREQNFGAWTGRRHDDLKAEYGQAYDEFWRSPASSRPPDGESFTEQVERVRLGLRTLPSGNVIIVAHSGTVRAALVIALEIPANSGLVFVIDPLSLTRVDRLARGWRVVAVNR